MKRPNHIRFFAAVTTVVAIGVSAFFIGRSSTEHINKELMSELETLRLDQSETAVVKRVSKQMENIAYQQKAVSDQERERAEKQSVLALMMRDRAEQESVVARNAEKKAMEAAKEAEEQRANALGHQKMAEQQRDEANQAKKVADTLTYRILGRTLGNSSIAQYESGEDSLAAALAYASWYFLKNYKGDTYQEECFSALKFSSRTSASLSTKKGGAVTALYPLNDIGCVVVTDFGEIEVARKNAGMSTVLLSDPKYNFRSVWADNYSVYALSLHGPLVKFSAGKENVEIPLPEDSYFRIFQNGADSFVIAGKRHALLFDKTEDRIVRTMDFQKNISEIAGGKGQLAVFFEDGSTQVCGRDYEFSEYAPPSSEYVTAVYFDERNEAYFVGFNDGSIRLYGADMQEQSILGHASKVTQIIGVDNILISTSYDKNLYIWDMEKENWLAPASVSFSGWPLSVCRFTDNEIAVGVSNGMIYRLNVSTDSMAKALKDSGMVKMDEETWNTLVGTSVPYIDFMK